MALLCSQLPSGPQSWQRRLEEQCKQWLLQSPASWCARPQRQRKHLLLRGQLVTPLLSSCWLRLEQRVALKGGRRKRGEG